MAKYYCKGCDQIMIRDCYYPTMQSMCSTANDKTITLEKVTDDVIEIFNQLKKLSENK